MQKINTFLMFEGQAEEAMNFYIALFEDSEIISISRYGPEGPGEEGTVIHATFKLAGITYMCIDSHVKHQFSFTPSISLYVNCSSEAEIETLCAKLSEDGKALMPLGEYGFSRKFAWIADRFGVTWQLNLA
ncbi:VOC family protein [Paenibacillus sp. 1011MAR3C5]|uniref:VOC family protein n=1 Tax=Paenibacillus sp. 1011MAR3C5 TaxID=1675787 RepID=UPI000E6C5F0F|nr:VOC family protein [Paenibacillus sp. 1011MAR3C5]RJE83593.1 VOC family protein [Paenibacillus sp. 1011MAR3C5]